MQPSASKGKGKKIMNVESSLSKAKGKEIKHEKKEKVNCLKKPKVLPNKTMFY